MSNFIDKTSIPVAITNSERFDLGHQHITTANWMQINPVLCKEMIPGEKCDVNLLTFSRMQPLAVPTFGRANIKERSFFVPMRTIWRAWNDFITDTNHVYSGAVYDSDNPLTVLDSVPTISNYYLLQSFVLGGINFPVPGGGNVNNKAFVTVVTNPSSPSAYDIHYIDGGITVYLKLTSYGRQWLKILESLGYKPVWDTHNTDTYSALPLLAMVKIILDWYFPSQYVNTEDFITLDGILKYDGSGVYQLNSTQLALIAKVLLYANYDSDYFTSAWDTPVAPSAGLYSAFKFVDITNNSIMPQIVTNDNLSAASPSVAGNKPTNGTPFIGGANTNGPGRDFAQGVFTQYVDTALHLLTDYMKRHQLAGARAVDRYLARFGKALNSEKMNRSNYIGSKMIPLQIGDVMSTANTGEAESNLGSFAGKGLAFEKNFSFKWYTDEYGYLIVLSTIIPSADIWQGIDRKVMHKSKTDFFTPEFDNLGVQAISTRELYNTMTDVTYLSKPNNSYMSFDANVFGFAPRYGEYKYANSQLTGDFVCQSLNVGNSNESAWHLMRTFSYTDFYNGSSYDYTYMKHSRGFVSGLSDHYQYNRIFTYMSTDEMNQPDPFTLIYDFQMVSVAPMKALYENYDWCDEDEGRRIAQENNGVKVN